MYPPCTLVPRRYKSGYILGTFGYMAHFMYPCPTPIEGGTGEGWQRDHERQGQGRREQWAKEVESMRINKPEGAAVGTPERKGKLRTCERLVTPGKQTLGRALIDWLGGLTLSGGDLDGQPFTVWPWEKKFILGTFGQPGNAALSIGRGNGKSGFCAGLATAVVAPGAPLHGPRREVVCVASSFQQARVIFEDVLAYCRSLGHDLSDRELWRRQDSQNMATLEYRPTGSRVRCCGSDPQKAHGLRPFLVLADEPAQWEHTKAEAMISALRTGLGKLPNSRLIALGTLPADGEHWFSQMLRDAPYHQLHAAAKDAPLFHARTWARANPSLKFLPSLKAQIKAEAEAARRDGVMLQSFKSLRLNMGLPDTVSGVLLEASVWASIEGEAERDGEYVLGLDLGGSTAQSAACAYYPASGRLECFAIFPEHPDLATRSTNDGAGSLYSECLRRKELLLRGDMVADIAELLSEALDRWGTPAAIAADRFKKAELIQVLNALDFPVADLVLRGMGWKDGAEDCRAFQLAALDGHLVPVKSLLMRASMAEARLVGDVAGNWKLAKGSEGTRRSRAKDDVVAAAILAVAIGRRGSVESTGGPVYALAG